MTSSDHSRIVPNHSQSFPGTFLIPVPAGQFEHRSRNRSRGVPYKGTPGTIGTDEWRVLDEPLIALSLDEASHLLTLAGDTDDQMVAHLFRLIRRGRQAQTRPRASDTAGTCDE